jgi:hypothetical protein
MNFVTHQSNGVYIVGDASYTYSGGVEGGCSNFQANMYIPSTIGTFEVRVIGLNSFRNCSILQSLEIGEGYTKTLEYAFCENYNLETVVLPRSLVEIGGGTFENCINLTSISIRPDSKLRIIGRYSFNECYKLGFFIIPPLVESIGTWTFSVIRTEFTLVYCGKSLFNDTKIFAETSNVKVFVSMNGPQTFAGVNTKKQHIICKMNKSCAMKNAKSTTFNANIILTLMLCS